MSVLLAFVSYSDIDQKGRGQHPWELHLIGWRIERRVLNSSVRGGAACQSAVGTVFSPEGFIIEKKTDMAFPVRSQIRLWFNLHGSGEKGRKTFVLTPTPPLPLVYLCAVNLTVNNLYWKQTRDMQNCSVKCQILHMVIILVVNDVTFLNLEWVTSSNIRKGIGCVTAK